MRQVFKYQPDIAMHLPFFDIELPENSTFLKVAMQHGKVTFWFEVDPKAAITTRSFAIVPTGSHVPQAIDGRAEFLETVFDGIFVWHMYEGVETRQ